MFGNRTLSAEPTAFFEQHCYDCHDSDTKKGNFDLTTLTWEASHLDQWIKVHDAIERGEMPPKKKKQPSVAERAAVAREIDAQLIADLAPATTGHGRVRLRRMTRVEFQNTLQDLLRLPYLDIVDLLPIDGRVAGYDKIAGGLDISPAHLVAYQEAVEKALDLAIAIRSTPPPVVQRRIYPAGLFKFGGNLVEGQFVLLKDKRPDPALPVRGGLEDKKGHVGTGGPDLEDRREMLKALKEAKSESSVGLLNGNLAGYEAAMNVSPIYPGMYRMKLSLWGFHWNEGQPEPGSDQAAVLRAHREGRQQEGGRLLRAFTAPSMQSNEVEITEWINAYESIVFDPVSVPWNGLRIGQIAGRAAKHVGPGVAIDWFEIEGPINTTWPPEGHQRLFGDLPITTLPEDAAVILPQRDEIRSIGGHFPSHHLHIPAADRKPPLETVQSAQPIEDGRRLLAAFLPKAFRRDVAPEEIDPYLVLLKSRLAARDCFEDAMRRVYVAVLTSPEFLFHPADGEDLTDLFSDNAAFTLASRLSFWLWNGPPDQPLLDAARDGSLQQAEVRKAQVERLLGDPRSERFIEDFTDQWLELRRLNETSPDPKLYPEYRFLLHEGMAAETRAFIGELIAEDLPIRSLLDPDFAMLTQRLAEHYGMDGVQGVEVRKVSLPDDSVRGSLLGQAAIHKITANGTTTSPVTRGVWVIDRLLNDPAPPPPPGISAIEPDTRGSTTVREQLDKHRHHSNCAACHAKIDPAGFALESFDPIGGFRERYRTSGPGDVPPEKEKSDWRVRYRLGSSVDASGELRDGRPFTDVTELETLLAADDEILARAFVAHLSRYATGTEAHYIDRVEIRRIVASTKSSDYGVRSLIHALAQSPLLFPKDL